MARDRATGALPADAAIEAWVREQYPDVLRYCLFHTVSRGEAEDAAQDTFLKAVRYGHKTWAHPNKRALLYRIARNVCVDIARQKRPIGLPDALAVEDAGLKNAEADADLALLLSRVSPQERELLLLRFQQELTLREVAQALGIPLRTAQSRLRSALKTLRQTLRKETDEHA